MIRAFAKEFLIPLLASAAFVATILIWGVVIAQHITGTAS
jgi:hypothetical protein